jgi:hypothetical protein
LSESSPKNADVPKSPFPTVAALVPSAGTITLQIELRSDAVCRRHRIRCVCPRAARGARPSHRKAKIMEVPSILQGPSLTRLLQGAAAGAVVTMIVGFNWGGWTLGSTVEKVAKERASSAVVAALAPICVEKFRQADNATANLSELNKINYDWDRGAFVEKGGWATMPGATSGDSAVARACAEMLKS